MSFTVPKDQPLGDMVLEIRGGGVIPLPYLIEKQRYNLTDEILERLRHYKDFADLKKTIEGEDANNDLVIEILQQGVSMIDDGGEKVVKEKIRGKEPPVQNKDIVKPDKRGLNDTGDREDAKSSIATPYIVKGDGQITIKVVSPVERDAFLAKNHQLNEAKAVISEEADEAAAASDEEAEDETPREHKKDASHGGQDGGDQKTDAFRLVDLASRM